MELIQDKDAPASGATLIANYTKGLLYGADFETIDAALDRAGKEPLQYAPWPSFMPLPVVYFSLLHIGDCLFLRFAVAEKVVVAAHSVSQAPVYKDSCVEFFLSFDQTGYYNLEFNCTGVCLAAFGRDKAMRQYLPESAISGMRRRVVMDREPQSDVVRWSLTLAVPLQTFIHHQHLHAFSGRQCRANFYKCGDALPQPHYLAWAPVASDQPDFHVPHSFGTLWFENP